MEDIISQARAHEVKTLLNTLKNAEVGRLIPERSGIDRRNHLFRWEIIRKPKITLIHIFPLPRALREGRDGDVMLKMREAVKMSCVLNVQNLFFMAEWIDEVESFCVSFLSVIDSLPIAESVVEDFANDFYKRIH